MDSAEADLTFIPLKSLSPGAISCNMSDMSLFSAFVTEDQIC